MSSDFKTNSEIIQIEGVPELRRWVTTGGIFLTPNADTIVNRELLANGGWERGLIEYIRYRCFPHGKGTFIDVGAHIGLVTIPLAKNLPNVNFFAFEPSPFNHALLSQNLELNELLGRVTLFQYAVSDSYGEIEMSLAHDNTVDNRIVVGKEREKGIYAEETRKTLPVKRTTIDMELGAMGLVEPIVMKMDIQGHEVAALRGMQKVQPDVLIMEYWPYGLERAGATREEISHELSRFTHGAPMLGVDTVVRPGLHLEIMKALLWGTENAIEIICAR